MKKVNFIAEVSSNHHQDINRCLQFVNSAKEAGCTSVKFQLFRIDQLFAPEILKKSETHRQRKSWELPLDFLPKIANECSRADIQFGCTPFYLDAVAELYPFVSFYKIASYELTWKDLLKECAQTGKPVILSTGMANMPEIVEAHQVLVQSGAKDITLLHCNSSYPTPVADANLEAIRTILNTTGAKVGWSDHTVNPGVIYRAVHKYNAEVIEFHLDIDGQGDEFKTGHCWLPSQISSVISTTRDGFVADGSGIKEPSPSEISDRLWRADPSDGLRPFKIIRETF
ncbi:N-acetylneuraminic acid synthase [bacterium]|nr:N-acetylneuraminic acid synthase [bacterium]